MQMMCDECGHVQDAKLKAHKSITGIHHHYVQCSRCKVKTTSFVTTKKIRRMIEENKKLREKKDKTIAEVKIVEDTDIILKEKMNELFERYKY